MKNRDINCIILCGGKGSRMNSPTKHKVCFEINGVPAINRIISNFKMAGIDKFTIVVGSSAGQVVECVGNAFEDIAFVYQKTPLGTGDAASKGLNLLHKMNISGPILITMGDKLIDPGIIEELTDKFFSQNLDAIFAVQPCQSNKSGGRVVFDENNRVRGICESIDIKSAILYKKLFELYKQPYNDAVALDIDPIIRLGKELIPSEKKRALVLSQMESIIQNANNKTRTLEDILNNIKEKQYIKFGDLSFDPEYIDNSKYTNAAVYLFKPEALFFALDRISSNNIQKEIYLTDVINVLSNQLNNNGMQFNVDVLTVDKPYSVMTYNNAEEFLEIENYFRNINNKDKANFDISQEAFKSVEEWLYIFKYDKGIDKKFEGIYGSDHDLINERKTAYIDTLNLFKSKYGANRKVVITRAPGRVNLMGRHIEHRGGFINVISINKEVLCVASPRNDDVINITNADTEFPDRSFKISNHLVSLDWKSWLNFLESDEIKKMVTDSRGDWINYVKAPILRLQYMYRSKKLSGMDIAYNGNVPMAAGLSSSSAIVVATAESAVMLNKLDVTPQKFVDLCGEGEWFVGSRGGSGDHAAMKFGSRGYIAHIGFLPFSTNGTYKFPENCKLIVANSMVKAQKTTNARDTFNQRIASYEFGLMMLKEKFPQYSRKIQYLRDVNPENLGINPSEIYNMLMELPEKVTLDELFNLLSAEYQPRIKQIMESHNAPGYYIIRPVILYGIAECERAKKCVRLLDSGLLNEFGALMNISHNGDRVVSYDGQLKLKDYDWGVSDCYLEKLISDLKSEDPERVLNAQIERQPGGYACSTPETDLMVDIAKNVPNVIGAQLSGAGLGGCVMILAMEKAVPSLINELKNKYYEPKGLNPAITICTAVNGSSVLSF